jgi:hypothetical protein
VLASAWTALVLAVSAFLIGFAGGGIDFARGWVVLLYVAIVASAAAMVMVVAYLLRRRTAWRRGADPGSPGPSS